MACTKMPSWHSNIEGFQCSLPRRVRPLGGIKYGSSFSCIATLESTIQYKKIDKLNTVLIDMQSKLQLLGRYFKTKRVWSAPQLFNDNYLNTALYLPSDNSSFSRWTSSATVSEVSFKCTFLFSKMCVKKEFQFLIINRPLSGKSWSKSKST